MKKASVILGAFLALGFLSVAMSQEADQPKQEPLCCGQQLQPVAFQGEPRPTGRKPSPPAEVAKRHASAWERHDGRIKSLPVVTLDKFDCRDGGYFIEMGDQGQCGYCHGYSGADVCSLVLAKNGVLPKTNKLSNQYGLDCHPFGGCNGGDEAQTIDFIKTNGFPTTSDYGFTYDARSHGCRFKDGTKLVKIADWGFCTPNQQDGVASTQDMKNCIYAYGPISVAFDASGCNGYSGGVMRGRGNNVDHAVICCGWKTEGGKTIFLGRNQWGSDWGMAGFFWIEEGSYSWGTESIWVTSAALPPPTPPPGPPQTDITVAVSPAKGNPGDSIVIVAFAVGGAGPYSFSYDYGDGESGKLNTHTYAAAGAYKAIVTATDSAGKTGTGSATVTIGSPGPGPGPGPIPGTVLTINLGPEFGTAQGQYIRITPELRNALDVLNRVFLPPAPAKGSK